MAGVDVSVVIPVYNNWELTRNCLLALASTIESERSEIIVVDNASSDQTALSCPELGKSLFGDAFRYVRNELNRNFAGASNQGARAAGGQYLVFLNNDTEVKPGWLAPLLSDFEQFPNLAATGPILAYPECGPLGRTVQHLGVIVSPWLRVSHLYQGIPIDSPLARKRRFFQAITAACMVLPRNLFLEAGGFDEAFVNGFEDVDLCARLWNMGYRFTVNPESLVLHYESRTQGRYANETKNSEMLEKGNIHHFAPDWHLKMDEDGLVPRITAFGMLMAVYPDRLLQDLDARTRSMKPEALTASLLRFPLWEGGWHALLSRTRDMEQRTAIFREMFQIFPTLENSLLGANLAMRTKNVELLGKCVEFIKNLSEAPESLRHKIQDNRQWCSDIGLTKFSDAYDAWLNNYDTFKDKIYPEFARDFLKLASRAGMEINLANTWFYNLWIRRGQKLQVDVPEDLQGPQPAFSILMPVYNPDTEYFRKALDSIICQTWPHWELCLADDASSNPEVKKIIGEYIQKDSRIKAVFREQNGHIAAATNSALELAEKPYIAFMDQDDELVPDALAMVASAIAENPGGLLFYSDEDKIDEYGSHDLPYFKSDWDPDLVLHQNYVCHLTVCRADRLRKIGGLKTDFLGAQDHELILRYTEALPPSSIVHIAEILYNWRAHDASTSRNLSTKVYALDSAVRAVQAHLDRIVPGASVTRMADDIWTRVHYPLPKARPLASLVLSGVPFPGFRQFLDARTRYPFEIVGTTAEAAGEILAFLDAVVLPWTQNWLEELVSCLWRKDVGAVAGSIIGCDGKQIHGGYLADSSERLKPIFRHAAMDPYIGWINLPRTVKAVDGLCLVTRRGDFEALGGLDSQMGSWAFQDYCLRLGDKGLRTVWLPFAKFMASGEIQLPDAPEIFHEKWHMRPFNKNLKIVDRGFALNLDTKNVPTC